MSENRSVFITGASRGIGKAIALRFAREGWNIGICSSRSEAALLQVKEEILSLGCQCEAFTVNVGDASSCESMLQTFLNRFGRIDVLVNNAGVSHVGLLQDMSLAEWDRVIQTNLSSVFYLSRLAIPAMLSRKNGKILNISSVWGNVGASCEAAYSASKGGINSLTKALGKELAPSNIQVNALACGAIDTDMNSCFSEEDLQALAEEIPAGRLGRPEEAAEMIWQLANAPAYLNGQIITLDGGWQ